MIVMYGANDWLVFYEATKVFLQGGNPYVFQLFGEYSKVYEPFWTYIFLAPFTLLPFVLSRYAMATVSFLVYALSAYKMKARPWQFALFLLSIPVLGSIQEGNIDWLVTAGLWMPPSVGLFFVLMKPQIGIGIAIYWAFQSYREGGFTRLFKTFAPVTGAYLLSFLLYGFWPKYLIGMEMNPASLSLFPWSLLLGGYLLYKGVREAKKDLATMSSPWLAPYVTLYNFSASLLSMFERPGLFVVSWVLLWIPSLFRIVFGPP